MLEPDRFGFSDTRTLAHVARGETSRHHGSFWRAWADRVWSRPVELRARRDADPTDLTATHEFDGIRSFRIGGALLRPPSGPVRAGLVSLHGAGTPRPLGEEAIRWRDALARGIAVLAVRVRGFPGSRTGPAGPGETADEDWALEGLDTPGETADAADGWIVPHAVADAVDACRALRVWLDEHASHDVPLFLRGESLGGGLATVATAQMQWRRSESGDAPQIARLGLGLPTFGDWSFRRSHPGLGLGRSVQQLLRRESRREDALVDRLRLMDAAVHARHVRCPVLCKLALADEVVPAPSAAAVFNALGTPVSRRWRFVTRFGHHEGGLSHLRREALFERCLVDFLEPSSLPREAMSKWLPLLEAPGLTRPPGAEDPRGADTAGGSGGLFGVDDSVPDADGVSPFERAIIDAYREAGRTLDDLPYTDEFEEVYASIGGEASNRTRREVFHRLHNLRKAGKLPRLGRSAGERPRIDEPAERALAELVIEYAGGLGTRDRLPYTPEMDRLVEVFNARVARELGPREVWRLVAKLAK